MATLEDTCPYSPHLTERKWRQGDFSRLPQVTQQGQGSGQIGIQAFWLQELCPVSTQPCQKIEEGSETFFIQTGLDILPGHLWLLSSVPLLTLFSVQNAFETGFPSVLLTTHLPTQVTSHSRAFLSLLVGINLSSGLLRSFTFSSSVALIILYFLFIWSSPLNCKLLEKQPFISTSLYVPDIDCAHGGCLQIS